MKDCGATFMSQKMRDKSRTTLYHSYFRRNDRLTGIS